MRYLSLFSGIEAASVAWLPLGWTCVGVAEIDPFPCAVLAHHYPDVPNLGSVVDITDAQIAALGPIDIVVGGSPCQDLSVAGTRAGLAGERSGLFHQQLRIFHAARHFCGARFLLWENVPGAFSSNRGLDFAVVAGEMAGCRLPVPDDGWGAEGVALGEHGLLEWAVLDAQWFGVAQRRRRVFALLDAGDWANRPPILLEPDSLRGDSPPRRKAWQVAPTAPSRGTSGGGLGTDFDCDGGVINAPDAARCVATREGSSQDYETTTMIVHTLRGEGFDASEDGTGRGTPLVPVQPYTLAIRGRGDSHDLEYRQDGTANALLTPNGGRGGIGVGAIAHAFDARQSDVIQYGDRTGPLDTDGHTIGVLAFSAKDHGADAGEIAPTLRAMGHGASHANGGGHVAVAFDTTQITSAANYSRPKAGDPCHPLAAGAHPPAVAFTQNQRDEVRDLAVAGALAAQPGMRQQTYIAFSAKDHGADAGEIAPTLRAMGHGASHANGGGHVAVAFAIQAGALRTNPLSGPDGVGVQADHAYTLEARAEVQAVALGVTIHGTDPTVQRVASYDETAQCLRARTPGNIDNSSTTVVQHAMQVRRLTPRECERLQGFPDDYTLIPWRKKPASECPDGPRYKALGNSMAVPVMRWIGKRIAMVVPDWMRGESK